MEAMSGSVEDVPSFYVGPANADGSQRVVSRTPEGSAPEAEDEFVLFAGDYQAANGFGAAPKWAVVGANTRDDIWEGLCSLMLRTTDDYEEGLAPGFKTAIQKWPTWVQARVSADIMRPPINYEHWEPQLAVGEERRMDSVSDIVETLHFAGFTTDVERIFGAHPITLSNVVERVLRSVPTGETEDFYTVRPSHRPIQTRATFANLRA